jgi:hypothetical protein
LNNREEVLDFFDMIYKIINKELEAANKDIKEKSIIDISQKQGIESMINKLDKFNGYLRNNLK